MSLLDGIKVIEVANVITGPFAGMLLSDLGADVVKVEAPTGDQFRRWEGESDEIRPAFAAYNRGKRSIGLNIKNPEGQSLFRDLVKTSDVIIENSRPGVMDRLGLGWEDARKCNPQVVYCYISGMGTTGPERDRPTYDAVAQALSGLWSQFTDLAAPEVVGPPLADQLTGLYATVSILAGLAGRNATGIGQKVEVSMLASCLAFQTASVAAVSFDDKVASKDTRGRSSQSYAFVASDGLPLAIHLSTPRKFWVALCNTIDCPELIDDPRYAVKSARIERYTELRNLLAPIFARKPREWWLRRLSDSDVPAAPILRIDEAMTHPQVEALGIIDRGSLPGLAGLVRSPVYTDNRYCASDRPPPTLGAETDEVLHELGLSTELVRRLREEGIVS